MRDVHDLPPAELLHARSVALACAVEASAPRGGLQGQIQIPSLAEYFEAWLLRPARTTEQLADVAEEWVETYRQQLAALREPKSSTEEGAAA